MTADRGIGGRSRALREMGIKSITVVGETIHPECRTEEELGWTVRFNHEAHPGEQCPRCDQPLSQVPHL
jgi:hypothetical protein